MEKEQLIETLKSHYPREVRKQLVKTTLQHEKDNNKTELTQQYKVINQIFSYVLHELGWEMSKNSTEWTTHPLEVMEEAFPKLSTTQWYQEQKIETSNNVDILLEK